MTPLRAGPPFLTGATWHLKAAACGRSSSTRTTTLYAGTTDGVYKTTDRGSNWADLFLNRISALAVSPAVGGTVYAGAGTGGVYKTTDAGSSWSATSSGLTSTTIRAVQIDPLDSWVVYACTDDGLLASSNGGASWSAITGEFHSKDVRFVSVDPSDSDVLYVGTSVAGVFKSTNGGSNWTAANPGLPVVDLWSIALDPSLWGRGQAAAWGASTISPLIQATGASSTRRRMAAFARARMEE